MKRKIWVIALVMPNFIGLVGWSINGGQHERVYDINIRA